MYTWIKCSLTHTVAPEGQLYMEKHSRLYYAIGGFSM